MPEILDYTKALDVLKEYESRDGLHVDSLLDSDKHGALTYNDFLILPGKISKKTEQFLAIVHSNPMSSFPGFRCESGIQGVQTVHPEGPAPVFPHGYRDRAQHGDPHGSSGWLGRYPQ